MIVDLVRIPTPDGCTLDGALQRSTSPNNLPLDAVVLIHGTGSNFYQSTLLEAIAGVFLSRGVAALRVNTRGHDGISTLVTSRGGQRLGAAYETVDDCRHDLSGWTKFARTEVGPRVAFLGHSLGAVKAIYAAVHEPALDPAAVIAISPPRLSYEWFCRSPRRDEFLATFEQAETLAKNGRGATLMEVTMPLPMVISAAGYVEKYGPDERINFLPLVPRLRCPSLFVFGGEEVATNVAFQKLPEEIAPLRPIAVVPGADHFYTGKRDDLIGTLADRLSGLWPSSGP